MDYKVGDVVNGYVLTENGWVAEGLPTNRPPLKAWPDVKSLLVLAVVLLGLLAWYLV